jgi:hypothetical protein
MWREGFWMLAGAGEGGDPTRSRTPVHAVGGLLPCMNAHKTACGSVATQAASWRPHAFARTSIMQVPCPTHPFPSLGRPHQQLGDRCSIQFTCLFHDVLAHERVFHFGLVQNNEFRDVHGKILGLLPTQASGLKLVRLWQCDWGPQVHCARPFAPHDSVHKDLETPVKQL